MITNKIASRSVCITLAIEASRKSFVLIISDRTIPSGKSALISSASLSISVMISFAFEPAVCIVVKVAPGCPETSLLKLYETAPSSMSATSFRRRTFPFESARITRSPYSSLVSYRPRYFNVYWKVFSESSPSVPVGDSTFCSPSTVIISDGTSPYCAITSGFNQIRMA